jgi:GTP cyclohydrolase I
MERGLELFIGDLHASASARETRATAARVARTWRHDLLSGYRQEPDAILRPLEARVRDDLVSVRDMVFASICRHHLLPFHGRAHVAYAPDGAICGLSSMGKLVDCLSRRLQLQETLTREIVNVVQKSLRPRGAACIVSATHACMTMRKGRKTDAQVVTAAFSGAARTDAALRRDLMAVLGLVPGRASRAPRRQRGRRVTTSR